jgi:hypothetical protein
MRNIDGEGGGAPFEQYGRRIADERFHGYKVTRICSISVGDNGGWLCCRTATTSSKIRDDLEYPVTDGAELGCHALVVDGPDTWSRRPHSLRLKYFLCILVALANCFRGVFLFLFYCKATSFRLNHGHLLKLATGDFQISPVPPFYNCSLLQHIREVRS